MNFNTVKGFLWITLCISLFNFSFPVHANHVNDKILKSPNDQRQYQSFQLPNQLNILLISDQSTDKAAAAVDVRVGSSSDPDHLQGLAHFLEHMLFLGTQKYPIAGEFKDFIMAHGGSYNATTAFTHTNYFFDIDKNYLEPALDRFAQFFIAPLFPEKYVNREKHAINAEYRAKLKDDGRRRLYALKQTVNPEHPFSQFSTGSLETLGNGDNRALRDALITFYRQHYSANLMNLVVLGKEPLEQLRQWVEDKFSLIQNTGASPSQTNVTLFAEKRLPARLNVVPIKDERWLILIFPIPSIHPYYLSKPTNYISHLIGHEGSGSLLSRLRNKGWANGLRAGDHSISTNEVTFEIAIKLTREGLTHLHKVTSHVFQHLRLLRREGLTEWRFAEQRKLAEINFRFQQHYAPLHYVRALATRLRRYPIQEVLHGPYAMKQYSPELIKHFLDYLIPHNMLMMVVAKELPTDSVEPWFNVPYQITSLAEKTLQSWQQDQIDPLLSLAKPNPFIPDDLTVKPLRQKKQQPELIVADKGFSLWYKQDASFQLPRSDFYVSLRSPIANSTPENMMLSELYVELVKNQLNESAYSARLGGLQYKFYRHLMGLSFIISGYHDKQYQLLARIVAALRYPVFDIKRFTRAKASVNRRLKNARRERPYRQVLNELPGLLVQNQWNQEQQRLALQSIELEDVRRFVSMLFKKIDLISLAHGNIYQEEALSFAGLLKEVLLNSSQPVSVERSQAIKLASGRNLVRQLNIDHDDSAIAVYFQGADTSFASRAQFSLLAHILASPFFQELRTERQLGYVVFSSKLSLLEAPGIVFSVQSPTTNPISLEEHIEHFLLNYAKRITRMSDAMFENYKSGLLTRVLSKEENLLERSTRYWKEINNEYYSFNSREQLAAAIRNITKQDLNRLYHKLLLDKSRRRLVIRSFGNKYRKTFAQKTWDRENSLILNTQEFKQNQKTFSG